MVLVLKKIKEKICLDKPRALPMRFLSNKDSYTWEDWHEENKEKYPIRYFIFESVPRFFGYQKYKIEQYLYRFKSVTYKKYHLLDLRQPKDSYENYRWGYIDECQQVLYANFNILVNFVKKQEKYSKHSFHEHIKWLESLQPKENVQNQIDTFKKIYELYEYWTADRVQALKAYDTLLNRWYKAAKNCNEEEREALSKESTELENKIKTEENSKLIEIIKVREHMW